MDQPVAPEVRTEAKVRSDSTLYNKATQERQLIHEQVNTAYNHHTIVEAFKSGRARDIGDEPKATGIPAIIIGSGPSLDYSIQFMKEWKGGIFCSSSQACTLMYYGIEPTHIVALDPFSSHEEISSIDWSKTKTKLIVHPGVWPSMVDYWPNEMLMYIECLGKPDSFYADIQKKMYSWREERGTGIRDPIFHYYIKTELILFASSPPLQMFCADFLGYGSIFLAGCDFGYPHQKERFTEYRADPNGEPSPYSDLGLKWVGFPRPLVVKPYFIMTNNGIWTEDIHLYYKKNFLSAWRLMKTTVYSMDQGIMPEVPYIDPRKVFRQEGKGFPEQTFETIAHTTEKYLAAVNAFVVESASGIGFVECNNPALDMVHYLCDLFNVYQCQACGVMLKSSTVRAELEGEVCPQCNKKALTHLNKGVDIQANIKKFQRLLEENGIPVNPEEWVVEPEQKIILPEPDSQLKLIEEVSNDAVDSGNK
jgi:hypothetical protein